jgi:hypothetical protein
MLTLRQIEVFRAVMRAQTLVGAASELKIAQPTVTKTIRRIEDLPPFDLGYTIQHSTYAVALLRDAQPS